MELLMDKDGKPKSQPVIIIEKTIRHMSDIQETNKNLSLKMDRLIEKGDELLVKEREVEDEELTDVIESYKDTARVRMRELDEGVHLIKAFPAVLEGTRGLTDKEIQPSASLMRIPDGTTLNAGVYSYMAPGQQQQQTQETTTRVITRVTY